MNLLITEFPMKILYRINAYNVIMYAFCEIKKETTLKLDEK